MVGDGSAGAVREGYLPLCGDYLFGRAQAPHRVVLGGVHPARALGGGAPGRSATRRFRVGGWRSALRGGSSLLIAGGATHDRMDLQPGAVRGCDVHGDRAGGVRCSDQKPRYRRAAGLSARGDICSLDLGGGGLAMGESD